MSATRDSRTFKLWTRLGSASVAGLAAASLTVTAAHAESGKHGGPPSIKSYQIAQGGEGGEGGEKAAAATGGDDVRYLTLLGLVEGHLRAGLELYRQGAADMAKTHMKHPGDELYADLDPALSARKAPGFADSLEALAAAVEAGKPVAEAEKAFSAVMEEIERARAIIDDLPNELKSLTVLIRTAADEYAVGVKEGKVTDPHEYQDAWGFTQAAKAQLAKLSEADRQRLGQSYEQIAGELNKLDAAWPSLVPPDKVTTDASVLYGAAARIEIAALAVK